MWNRIEIPDIVPISQTHSNLTLEIPCPQILLQVDSLLFWKYPLWRIKSGVCTVADPGFGQGGGQKSFPRFCQHSEAKSGEQSKPILAGVQGLP